MPALTGSCVNLSAAVAALLALPLAFTATAAPRPAPPDRTAALRQHAAPIWTAATRDHVAELAGRREWIRTAYQHDPRAVRYTVRGDRGTVTAPGTMCVSAPCRSAAAAKAAPWKIRTRKTLVLTFTWKAGKWHGGPVEWKDAG